MKLLLALPVILLVSAEARAEYVRAKPNGAAEAEAYCNMVSRGARQGFFAFGSQEFVAGAAIGNGLGNLIRQSMVKKDCMRMMGYEWKKPQKAKKSRPGRDTKP